MEMALLAALRAGNGRWVGCRALAERLCATEADVSRAVEALQRDGYRIEHCLPLGYRLVELENRVIASKVRRQLDSRIIGRRVITLERVTSTNDIAWREALMGASEGTVVLAEEQTAGRGRMGRIWHSAPGTGLLMSVILRPEVDAQQAHLITVMGAVAVAQALRKYLRVQARIRWPNDITIKDRKVAGVLVEGRTLATGSVFVIGIGVNVNAQAGDFPPELREAATSVAIELGHPVARLDVAQWTLLTLERWYRDFRSGDYGRIATVWRQLSSTLGRRVALLENGREFKGTVLDLSLEEGLIVRLDEGVTRIVHASTATLRQLF